MCQVLGLVQGGGVARLLHKVSAAVSSQPGKQPHSQAVVEQRAGIERWEGPGRRKGSEVGTLEPGIVGGARIPQGMKGKGILGGRDGISEGLAGCYSIVGMPAGYLKLEHGLKLKDEVRVGKQGDTLLDLRNIPALLPA